MLVLFLWINPSSSKPEALPTTKLYFYNKNKNEFWFYPSIHERKIEELIFYEGRNENIITFFLLLQFKLCWQTKSKKTINLLIRKLLIEKKERTFFVINSNIRDMKIELVGPSQQSKPIIKVDWLEPSRRKTFKRSLEKNKTPQSKRLKNHLRKNRWRLIRFSIGLRLVLFGFDQNRS